ncbi:MAG: FecR domain-containing protein [Dehalococcoidia bacterium]|nr:FecR domain-containing protein [Dehalococcoidia bacterium]
MSQPLPFESVLDLCVQQIVSGAATVEQCLARYPEHRDALEPALRTASELVAAPRPAVPPLDPARREAFMDLIRETPQDAPPRRVGKVGGVRGVLSRLRAPSLREWGGLGLGAVALRVAPAAAVALFALFMVFGQGATPAAAATLTVFTGEVEQQVDGAWLPLADGAAVHEGEAIRTLPGGHALLTFSDGSTASLAQETQVLLTHLSRGNARHIELDQASGRLWNDVVTSSGDGLYLVRTPHATVQAQGTVFATLVAATSGETEVSTVDGLVRVISAGSSVDVETGQVVRANAERIATPKAIPFVGEITVRGPVAAALTSPDGAATGLLPSGMVFRQVPGVTTTGARETQQHMYVGDIRPDVYSLWLRRYDEGEAIVVVETADGRLNIPVAGNVATARILIAIDIVDGSVFMRALDTTIETVPEAEAPPVRLVESARTRRAVDLGTARAQRTDTLTADATQAATETPSPTRTREGRGGQATPSATATPAMTYATELRAAVDTALDTGDNTALAAVLGRLLEGDRRQDRERLEALAEVLEDPAARVRVVAVLLVTADDEVLEGLQDAVDALDALDGGRASRADRRLHERLEEGLQDLWRSRDDRDLRNGRDDGPGNDRRNDRGNDREDGRDDDRGRGNDRGRGAATAEPSPSASPAATERPPSDPDDDRRGGRGNNDRDDRSDRSDRGDEDAPAGPSDRRWGGLAELLERWRERLRGGR